MKTDYRILIISILLALNTLNYSCSKDKIVVHQSLGTYPSEIGNSWVYMYRNSSTVSYQSFTVTITGESKMDNGYHVKKLVYEYPNNTLDTNYLYSSIDTARIYENRYNNSGLYGFVFPLEAGKSWVQFNGFMTGDSTIVRRELIVEVFPNEYYKGFELFSNGWVLGGGYYCWTLFVPGIGIIEQTIYSPYSQEEDYMVLTNTNFRPTN